jgi:hypothetical protein
MNLFSKRKKDQKIQCLFQLTIHGLEDFDYTITPNLSLADCLIDLLQHQYSIVWRTKRKKGVTKVCTIKSKFGKEDERDRFENRKSKSKDLLF